MRKIGIAESDLLPGEMVYPRRHTLGRWCLRVRRRGHEQDMLRDDDCSVRLFDSKGGIELFCRRRRLVLGEEGVTDRDLQRGETVYLRKDVTGNLYLLVRRDGMEYPVRRFPDDGHTRVFDDKGEVDRYCQAGGFVLEEWDGPVLQEERRLLPAPEDNLPLPPILPEWEEVIKQALDEAVEKYAQKQAPKDLERLAFLIEDRECLRAELKAEFRRRKVLGNKSCLCPGCINRLSYPLREVQEKIDRIWSWWATSLGTTPADVTADRWP